eukprot:11194465-Lingulodinium_polyedra.AAC.1
MCRASSPEVGVCESNHSWACPGKEPSTGWRRTIPMNRRSVQRTSIIGVRPDALPQCLAGGNA